MPTNISREIEKERCISSFIYLSELKGIGGISPVEIFMLAFQNWILPLS
jgi:hypothetical protein